MGPGILRNPVWLVLAAILCAAGTWTYADRVLIAYQVSDAAAHDRPRGNLSDLYPRWLGARELLLHGRDPYSAEVTSEIQAGYYGRPLDGSRPDDPRDKAGFAYPVYVVFFLAPTVRLPFPVIQGWFFWLLVLVTLAVSMVWLRVLRWSSPFWSRIIVLALTFGSIAVMQGLKLQQISLLVAGLIAAAIALLMAGQAVAAGILLALATIKPQIVVLLLLWLALWTLGDWRRRYRLFVSFVVSMAILCGAAEWLLPQWIPRFWHAVHDYQNYTGAFSVLDGLLGKPSIAAPWNWILELGAFTALLVACWKERKQSASAESFAFMASLVLAVTILLVPTSAQYNQVLLIPALLWLVRERRSIWRRSGISRILFVMTVALVVWPWISSVVLAALSFILPRNVVERWWAVPIWTTTQIPVAVAALMLLLYYQTTFAASEGPGSS
jgi:hypothetical protein